MKKTRIIAGLLIFSLILPGNLAVAKSTKKPQLNKSKLTLKVGSKKRLFIKDKKKFKIKKVTFSSSKTKIAKVSKKGVVKALRKGKATITCKVVLKSEKIYRLKCKVTVKDKTKTPSPNEISVPQETAMPSGTGNPQVTAVPTETGKPQGSTEPTETGNPQGSTEPTETGNPQASTKPTETGNPQGSTEPTETGKPQESTEPTETGNPQESTEPTETGKPQGSTEPAETGNPQESTEPTETGNPQGSTEPTESGKPQGSTEPAETKAPATQTPTKTPVLGTTAITESRFTLPPAVVFTPSPTNVPKVSHQSKNGITTMDNGVMRDDIDAYDIVWDMGLGTNLGNTMECCGDWINPSSVTNYETAWGAPVTTQEMLTKIKAAGFSSIRIPVGWSNMMLDDGEYTINEAYFNRVETIMNYALNADMYVIINIHFDGGWWGRFGSMDETERQEAMKKYENMWLQIANRYQEYSDYVIFESANEELGERLNSKGDYAGSGRFESEDDLYRQTNIINQTFVNIVRSTGGNNARRYLLIAGYDTNIEKTCDPRYQMPEDNIDSHLMVSIHCYSPATYCIADAPDNSWGYMASWGSDEDIAALKKELGYMHTYFVKRGYPVIIGEYGVTDTKINENESVRKEGRDLFFKTVCEYATQNNMCPTLWDCSQVFDRNTCSMTNEVEEANYLSLSQSIKSTPVVKPDIVKDPDPIWSGKLVYSGWNPQAPVENDDNTFSLKSVGGCYAISGINWDKYEHPVLKVRYSGNGSGDALTCKFYSVVNEENQYWLYPENDIGLIASQNFKKGVETTVDLSSAELSGVQKIFFKFEGTKELEVDFTVTVTSGK